MSYVYVSECELAPRRRKRSTKSAAETGPKRAERKDLPRSQQRKSALAVHNILKQLHQHDELIQNAIRGVDATPPSTRHYKKWRDQLRTRDPMPELDLPRDVKHHYSWTQLCYFKRQKEWHDQLVNSAKCTISMELPKHVKQYQEYKKDLLKQAEAGVFSSV